MDDSDVRTRAPSPDDLRACFSDASRLLARAYAYLPRSPRFGRARGYRVLWLERGELRFRDVVDHPRGCAIVGRHSRAHVRLRGDSTVALRHFLLRAGHTRAGVPAMQVTDLLAPLPLLVDGSDEPQLSCTIEGAFSARLGAHVICALPFDGCAPLPPSGGPGRGDRPDEELEDGDDDDIVPPWLARRVLAPRPSRAGGERATLTPGTRTTHLGDLECRGPSPGGVALELVGAAGRTTVWVSRGELEGLVVLGRYERCLAGASVFSRAVSRMHVGITRSSRGLEVIDLASTQGVLVDGERAHRRVVGEGAIIALTDDEHVRIRLPS